MVSLLKTTAPVQDDTGTLQTISACQAAVGLKGSGPCIVYCSVMVARLFVPACAIEA